MKKMIIAAIVISVLCGCGKEIDCTVVGKEVHRTAFSQQNLLALKDSGGNIRYGRCGASYHVIKVGDLVSFNTMNGRVTRYARTRKRIKGME